MKTLIIDTETTGLIKNSLQPLERQPHIVELFALSLDKDNEEKFHSFFKQSVKLSEEIIRITGINDAMLVDAPFFSESAENIKLMIEGHNEVIAHNAAFDTGMIDLEMKRAGLTVTWPKIICTVESTIHIKGHRLKLSDLHQVLFGEDFDGAHRAESDVRALRRCVLKLRELEMI